MDEQILVPLRGIERQLPEALTVSYREGFADAADTSGGDSNSINGHADEFELYLHAVLLEREPRAPCVGRVPRPLRRDLAAFCPPSGPWQDFHPGVSVTSTGVVEGSEGRRLARSALKFIRAPQSV